MSDLKMAREALTVIQNTLPYIGGNERSIHSLRQQTAKALEALSAPEAAPASPSPGAWTEEELERVARAIYDRFLALGWSDYEWPWDSPQSDADGFRELAKAGLSTLNATPPAPQTSEEVEAVRTALNYAADIRWHELAHGSTFTVVDRQMLGELFAHAMKARKALALYPTPPTPAVIASREVIARILFDRTVGRITQDQATDAILALLSSPPAAGVGDQKRRAVPLSTISEGWRKLGSALCTHAGGHYSWPPVGGLHAHNVEYVSLHGNDWHLPTIFAALFPAPPAPVQDEGGEG